MQAASGVKHSLFISTDESKQPANYRGDGKDADRADAIFHTSAWFFLFSKDGC